MNVPTRPARRPLSPTGALVKALQPNHGLMIPLPAHARPAYQKVSDMMSRHHGAGSYRMWKLADPPRVMVKRVR